MYMVLKSIVFKRNEMRRDVDVDDMEIRVTRYKPVRIEELTKVTNFSRKEIQMMYRGFKQDCPSGSVNEAAFKEIYSKFFPQGDSSAYAHYVFQTFDSDKGGSLTFEQLIQHLSLLARGSSQEKLQWVFRLYDVNKDGVISKSDLLEIVVAIYDLMGRHTNPPVAGGTPREHAEIAFQKMDLDHDGVISPEEFMVTCLNDELVMTALHCFDTLL